MNTKIKTIFMGTADFAVPSFEALINDNRFDIVACFTQPDKAIGRSSKLQETPIKKLALKNNIPVYQPKKISLYEDYSKNNEFPISNIDLIVVVSYAQMIPEKILNIPKYGCVNVHGSLLPKYRGSSCIQASILNGDKISGVTIMQMDKGMDTGNILNQAEIKLSEKETTESLFDKISQEGAKILPDTLIYYINGNINPKKQDESKSSIVKKISKGDGRIDWNNSATHIERQIRAMTSWPGAWTNFENRLLKIIKADLSNKELIPKKIGQIFQENKQLYIQCKDGVLEILEIQLEGKKPLKAIDFINGNKNILDKILG